MSLADRFNLNEERDPIAWKFYLQQLAQRWDPEETYLGEDRNEFNRLNPRYKRLVADIAAFFAPGDGLVCAQIQNLMMESSNFAERAFMGEQFSIEIVHARAYKDIIMTFFEGEERKAIFNMVDTLPCVTEKGNFVTSYMDNKALPLGLRYVAAAVSEGVFFVSLFAIVFYIKEKKILNRFCFINEQVSKDEKLHRDYYCVKAGEEFRKGKFSAEDVIKIVQEGINIEKEHIRYILKDPIDDEKTDQLGGLTVDNMDRFIATLGDQILVGIGLPRHFTYEQGTGGPLGSGPRGRGVAAFNAPSQVEEFEPNWMKGLSMARKTNFYESIVGNYTMISGEKNTGIDDAFGDLEAIDI